MVDLHCHILPEMDDGSSSAEMSHQMLDAMGQQGVKTVVATPHFYASRDLPEAFLQRREKAAALLGPTRPSQPQIVLGAEVAYFDGMGRSEAVLRQLQLGDSGLLLVEMPFCEWSQRMIREICDLHMQTGLTPVLAHVDRYLHGNQLPQYADILLDHGVLFQCNTEPFTLLLKRGKVLRLLQRGMLHFLGSDAHNLTTRPPQFRLTTQIIENRLGRQPLEELMAFSRTALLVE